MSGIRKKSFSIPEGIPFAHSALKQAGCGSYSIAPHWVHDLTMIIAGYLPEAVVGKQSIAKMKGVRKRLIARDEREAAAKKD
jgi:hypothetical protein